MHKFLKTKKSAFTLIEITVVAMILGILIPSIFWIYNFIIKSNREISARQNVIQQSYEFFEKLNIWMQDYTIDYEEYFNRQRVWCVEWWWVWENFTWNIWMSWYCTEFTAYGNENSIGRISSWYNDIYYCSSKETPWSTAIPKVVKRINCWKQWTKQSYWQYAALFTDVGADKDGDNNLVWDSDDRDVWEAAVDAIVDANSIQELYLISNDGKSRLFFRRRFIWTWWENWEHVQYKIQMLRLRWFDAWRMHNFEASSNNVWLYDWKIDTWACDYGMWFEWHWASVSWAYSEYHLPKDIDDCWIDLTQWSTTIISRNISISPLTDPALYWSSQDRQINPYVKILTVNSIYAPFYKWRMSESLADFKVPLQTTINTRSFYSE